MKTILQFLSALMIAAVLVSCSKSGSDQANVPDPATQPEAQAILYERTVARVKGMIANKDFKHAQEALDVFKKYKLTPEQQKEVDQLQAQIPK